MTSPLEPSPSGDAAAALAVQVAALRGQVRLIFARLDMPGITGDLNLAGQFAELARAVTQALDSPPRGPAAPYWIGLDPADHARQLTELRQWTDTILRREYGGYQLRGCWVTTRTPSGNCPPWPPNGTAPTAATGPTWTGHWNSTTGGSPAPAPNRRHHPPVHPRMRRPAASVEGSPRTHALRSAAATGFGKGPAP